jgi:hypothetical protein
MTTGSTTIPRAAAPQLPRIVKKLGTVGCLGLALLFVRPCQTPAAPGGAAARAVADSRGTPATFTVASLRAHELVGTRARSARPAMSAPSFGVPSGSAGRPL